MTLRFETIVPSLSRPCEGGPADRPCRRRSCVVARIDGAEPRGLCLLHAADLADVLGRDVIWEEHRECVG